MKKQILILFASWFVFNVAMAEEIAPDVLVKKTIDEVVAGLTENKEIFKTEPAKLYEFVETKVLGNFDFKRMSKLVLARNWKKANDEQKERFAQAFKGMLVRTYAKSLTEYNGQEVKYLPFKGVDAETGQAQVRTQISATGEPIPINYRLAKNESGQWKVIDIAIDGISLVTNYRSSFMRQFRRQGMDGLIESLEAKNAKAQTKSDAS